MTIERATEILKDSIRGTGLTSLGDSYLDWESYSFGPTRASLDGFFTADELEAIAIWMRAHNAPEEGK
jgi:hypothetical protein